MTPVDCLSDTGDTKKKGKKPEKALSVPNQQVQVPLAKQPIADTATKEETTAPNSYDLCGDCHRKVQPNH